MTKTVPYNKYFFINLMASLVALDFSLSVQQPSPFSAVTEKDTNSGSSINLQASQQCNTTSLHPVTNLPVIYAVERATDHYEPNLALLTFASQDKGALTQLCSSSPIQTRAAFISDNGNLGIYVSLKAQVPRKCSWVYLYVNER